MEISFNTISLLKKEVSLLKNPPFFFRQITRKKDGFFLLPFSLLYDKSPKVVPDLVPPGDHKELCTAMLCFVMLRLAMLCCSTFWLWFAMLIYALPCAMFCYPLLAFAVLCYGWLRCHLLCLALLRFAMPYGDLLCYALLCCASLCFAVLCFAVLRRARLCCALFGYPWLAFLCY